MKNDLPKNILTIVSISFGLLFYLIPSGSLFQQFMPRSVCMFHDQKLIIMHGIADGIIFISYTVISILLFVVFGIIKSKNIPLKGFIWMFGIFIMFCGLTHLMGVINLWVTYYWVDGAVKVLCAISSCLVAIYFLPAASVMKEMKTNEEYKEVTDKLELMESKFAGIKIQLEKLEKGLGEDIG